MKLDFEIIVFKGENKLNYKPILTEPKKLLFSSFDMISESTTQAEAQAAPSSPAKVNATS